MPSFSTMSQGLTVIPSTSPESWLKWEWNQLKIITFTLSVYVMARAGGPETQCYLYIWRAEIWSQKSTLEQNVYVFPELKQLNPEASVEPRL